MATARAHSVAFGSCLALAGLALAGCGTQSADAGDIADKIRARAEQNLTLEGSTVDKVTCDGDLPATAGASTTCTVLIGLDGMTATNVARAVVDSADGDSLKFTMRPVSWSAPRDYLAAAVGQVFQKLVDKQSPGGTVRSTKCPEPVSTKGSTRTGCYVSWTDATGEKYLQAAVVTVQKTGNIDVQVSS